MEDSTGEEELSTPLLATAGGDGDDDDDDPEHGTTSTTNANNTGGSSSDLIASSSPLTKAKKKKKTTTTTSKEEEEEEEVEYGSHFTLRIPTSTVHFRGSVLRVIDTDQDQIILQEVEGGGDDGDDGGKLRGKKKKKKVLVKRLSPGTFAQRFLRVGYTLITIMFLGFLFVFCFQVLVFLFVALPVDSGYTSGHQKVDTMAIISTLLSFPVMMHGMSSLMTLGCAFVVDTYNGAALFRSTVVEILYMLVFLIVPIIAFAINLLSGQEEPWRRTASLWAVMVSVMFCFWGLAVTYNEVKACFWLVERHFHDQHRDTDGATMSTEEEENGYIINESGDDDVGIVRELSQTARMARQWRRLGKLAHRALLFTQTARYSGVKQQRFSVMDGDVDVSSSPSSTPQETSIGIYSRLTTLSLFRNVLRMFDELDPPKKIYSSEEVRDILPFMTKSNWSMQKMWCSGDIRRRNVVVARGPSALTRDQMKYSVLCSLTSSGLTTLLVIGGLAWLEMGAGVYVIALALSLVCCIYPLGRTGLNMYRMYDGMNNESELEEEEIEQGNNIFQVWETIRITQPRAWYCYARIALEIVFLFLWPFINMLVKRNYPVALVFLCLGSFTFLWRYFDACAVLSELGSMSDVVDKTTSHKTLYRLNEVIGRVISNKGRRIWTWIFSVSFLAVLVLFMSANGGTESIMPDERAPRPPVLLVDDFYYEPEDNTLAYPSCKLSKGFGFPGGSAADLADYSFLSAMAYETSAVTDHTLPKWFGGPNVVVDEEDFVSQYREDSGTAATPVYFKLFSVPAHEGYAIMSIRGSETSFDWLANLQLWSAAGIAQLVKWLTPFGWVWEPILPDLIRLVNMVESESISNVSYYKTTTKFVNDVMAGYGGGLFSNLHVTGASLGGGLAIITGAQTDAYTVAISGLGATLSREAFDPPIKLEKLNAQTFNFIPERDLIARIGGRAPFFQNGACTAPKNSIFGCHSMWRSVCEITYSCGSNSRPVPCRCVSKFGYPKPIQNGTRSFEEACQEANTTWYDTFPPM